LKPQPSNVKWIKAYLKFSDNQCIPKHDLQTT